MSVVLGETSYCRMIFYVMRFLTKTYSMNPKHHLRLVQVLTPNPLPQSDKADSETFINNHVWDALSLGHWDIVVPVPPEPFI